MSALRSARRLAALSAAAALLAAAHSALAQSGSGRQPAPKGAEVYFHYPLDGLRVPERFTVRMGLKEMGLAPAGTEWPNTGHHHLLINTEPGPPDQRPARGARAVLRPGTTAVPWG